jgi:hypothetical protein
MADSIQHIEYDKAVSNGEKRLGQLIVQRFQPRSLPPARISAFN